MASARNKAYAAILCFAIALLGAAPAQPYQRAVLDLRINGAPSGQVTVVIAGDDVLIGAADLRERGVHGMEASTVHLPYGDFLSLKSTKPHVAFAVNADALALDLTVPATNINGAQISFNQTDTAASGVSSARSGFLNYALTKSSGGQIAFSGEAGVNIAHGLLNATFSGGQYGSNSGLSYTLDAPSRARRVVLGDSYADTSAYDALGEQVEIRGVTVSRQYDMNPNFVRYSVAGVSGVAQTPSTALVYVNGSLVRQIDLPPGSFSLNGLPLADGSNNVQVVLRDAFGRVQTINQNYYQSANFLRKGLTDYSYSLGVPHMFGGTVAYGGLSFLGRYAFGVRDNLMVEGRTELSKGVLNAGAGIDYAFGGGTLHGSFAASKAAGSLGSAADLGYTYAARRLYVAAHFTARSSGYSDILLTPLMNRAALEESLSIGTPLGSRQSLALAFVNVVPRDSEVTSQPLLFSFQAQRELTLTDTVSLGRLGNLSVGIGRGSTGGASSPVLLVNYTGVAANGMNLFASHVSRAGQTTNTATLQQPVPVGQGLGYSLESTSMQGTVFRTAEVDYHARSVDLTAIDMMSAGTNDVTLSAAGAIGFVGNHLFLARPIFDSYALINVGAPNVETFVNNQSVGRSDKSGYVLAPSLPNYRDSEISLDAAQAPGDVLIENTKRFIDPGYRSGSLVTFDAHSVRAFVGQVRVLRAGGTFIPAYGLLTVSTPRGSRSSDLGDAGEFYLENVASGSYPATIKDARGSCTFTVVIPPSSQLITKLGTLTCTAH